MKTKIKTKDEREPSDFVGVWCPHCRAPITEFRAKGVIKSGNIIVCPYCKQTFRVA